MEWNRTPTLAGKVHVMGNNTISIVIRRLASRANRSAAPEGGEDVELTVQLRIVVSAHKESLDGVPTAGHGFICALPDLTLGRFGR